MKKPEAGEIQADREIRERQAGAEHRIAQIVDEFQIFETDAVGEAAGGEVRADDVRARVVLVLKGLIAHGAAGGYGSAVKITEAIKHADVFEEVEIQARVVVGFAEGSAGVAGVDVEGRRGNDRREQILVGVFGVEKEEDFVFEDRAAEIAAVLIALIGRGRTGKRSSESLSRNRANPSPW